MPSDGRITSLTAFSGTFQGTELVLLVSPGNAQAGVNYKITTQLLATLLNNLVAGGEPTFVNNGVAVYDSLATDTRILVDKTVPSATSIVLAPSQGYEGPVLVKDIAGTSTDGASVAVTFSSGQTADGLASVSIRTAYGAWLFNPLSAGGWYLTVA